MDFIAAKLPQTLKTLPGEITARQKPASPAGSLPTGKRRQRHA
jgi:hypothetical protein